MDGDMPLLDQVFNVCSYDLGHCSVYPEPAACPSLSACTQQCQILSAVWISMGGDVNTVISNSGTGCCAQNSYGIGCSNGQVTSLNWNGMDLQGSIATEMSSLSYLNILNLGSQSISGELTILSRLTSLRSLILSSNSFSGNLGFMTALRSLTQGDLNNNLISASIPPGITAMSSIEYLHLGTNSLTGVVSSVFGSMPNLTSLYLDGNLMSGALPWLTQNMSDCAYDVGLCSVYPEPAACPSVTACTQGCQILSVIWDAMSGTSTRTISSSGTDCCAQGSYGIGCLGGEVTSLDWDSQGLIGTIPTALSYLSSLKVLNLGGQSLSGTLSVLQYLASLETLVMSSNQFADSLDCLTGLSSLYYLDMKKNSLSATMPTGMTHLSSVVYLNLESNLISGIVSSVFGPMTNLGSLYLSANSFTGAMPWLTQNLVNCEYDSTLCTVYSEPGACPSVSACTQECLVLSNVWAAMSGVPATVISGSGTTCCGQSAYGIGCLSGSVTSLDWNNQALTGTVPTALSYLSGLAHLNLESQTISGSMSVLASLTGLQTLQLGSNSFSGSLDFLTGLTKLQSM